MYLQNAQWTLCDRESDGTNDVMNIKKMENIKKHFIQEYASNENTNFEKIIQHKVENQEV